MKRVSVVIPFFQREKGILNRALKSIEKQESIGCLHRVIVVDDESPVSGKEELNGLNEEFLFIVDVIEKVNGGVSSARNLGLESIPDGTDIVAFLDSDDTWAPNHLANMLEAFEQGAEFYFSNFLQLNQHEPAFERGGKLNLSDQKPLGGSLYQYEGDMLEQILTGNLIGTPTVGFKVSKFKGLRFIENLQFAGEDYLFWLEIASFKPCIMFNTEATVTCLEGVNIFSSASWGTMHLQKRLFDEILFREKALNDYELSDNTRIELERRVSSNAKQFFLNAKSMLFKGRLSVIPFLFRVVVKHPKIIRMAFAA